jgi:hypothetical protein
MAVDASATPAALEQARALETLRKERAVLTDDELAVYLGFVHPQEHWRLSILERQVWRASHACSAGFVRVTFTP